MPNPSFSFDHTMRELFEYPDPSVPFVVWTGDFHAFVDRAIVCHWHNEFEYGVLLSGELDYNIDGQHIRIKRGDAIFINADAMHMAAQVDGREDAAIFTVSFLPSMFPGGVDGTMFKKYFRPMLQSAVRGFPIDHTTREGGEILKLLHELYGLDGQKTDHYELLCLSLISRIWSFTLGYAQAYQRALIQSRGECGNKNKAKDILTYIHEHYAEDVSLKNIARQTGISSSECFRCFRRYTSKSPIEYLTEYRLAHAVNMLLGTDKTVTQIAMECGFSNSSYFGKVFKNQYATAPTRFRGAHASDIIKEEPGNAQLDLPKTQHHR